MTTFFVLFSVPAVAALVGILIFRWRKGRSNVWIALGTTFLALLFLGVSLAVFFIYALFYNQTPLAHLRDSTSAEIVIIGPKGRATISLAFSQESLVEEDFEISIRVDGAPDGEQKVQIQTSPSIVLRSLQNCGGDQSVCARATNEVLSLGWVASPIETGSFITQIGLPVSLTPESLVGEKWRVGVFIDGTLWARNIDTEFSQEVRKEFRERQGDHNPRLIENQTGRLALGSVAIDLSGGEIRFETQVFRTLGISEGTYTTLAFIGAILASGLGSGWLISAFVWLRKFANHTS